MVRLDLQCLSKYTTTSTTGVTTNADDKDTPILNYDIKYNDNKIFEESSGLLMEFTPDSRNLFLLGLKQKINRQNPNKIGITFQNIIHKQKPQDIERKFYMDVEEGVRSAADYSVGASWNHKCDKPGREITAGMEWILNIKDTPSSWTATEISAISTSAEYFCFQISTHSGRQALCIRLGSLTNRDLPVRVICRYAGSKEPAHTQMRY